MNVLGLWVATALISGIEAVTSGALIWAGVSLGLINAFIRPVLVLFTFPITLLTLGLFLLVINAAMLHLASWFVDGFDVQGFFASVFGAIIVSIISWLGSAFINGKGSYDVLIVRR
jgi:putative membrane protein